MCSSRPYSSKPGAMRRRKASLSSAVCASISRIFSFCSFITLPRKERISIFIMPRNATCSDFTARAPSPESSALLPTRPPVVPTSLTISLRASPTIRFISPLAPMSSGICVIGSMNLTRELVPHLRSICIALFMKYTSAWNGFAPPVGRDCTLFSRGRR